MIIGTVHDGVIRISRTTCNEPTGLQTEPPIGGDRRLCAPRKHRISMSVLEQSDCINQGVRTARAVEGKGPRRPSDGILNCDVSLGRRREPSRCLVGTDCPWPLNPQCTKLPFGKLPATESIPDGQADTIPIHIDIDFQSSVHQRVMSSQQRKMGEPVGALPKSGSQKPLHEASGDLTSRIGEIGRRIETGDGSDRIATCRHPLTKKVDVRVHKGSRTRSP